MRTIVLEYDGRAFVPQEAVSLPAGYQATLEVEDNSAGEELEPMTDFLRMVDELNAQFPPDPDTPRDLATQHPHYRLGLPKDPKNNFPPES